MHKVFGKCLGAALVLLTFIVLLSIGTAGSAEAADAFPGVIEIYSDADMDQLFIDNPSWTGSGTESEPYIIENLDINATGFEQAILIRNTDKHLIIRDCILHDYNNYGMFIQNARNITLENNTCDPNSVSILTGIYILECAGLIIDGNDCSDNFYGIDIGYSNNFTINDNNCSRSCHGIHLFKSEWNDITNNTCNYTIIGIILDYASKHNFIDNNTCNRTSSCGIKLDGGESYSNSYNFISNNTCDSGADDIYLLNSDNNTLYRNHCGNEMIGASGIYLTLSNNNYILENNCSYDNTGISIYRSSHNIILANICMGNDGTGIGIDSSINNTVTFNECHDNAYIGISLNSALSITTDIKILNNNCSGNGIDLGFGAGIYLSAAPSNPISNVTISGNNCSGNLAGIIITYSHNITISNNNASDCVQYGIQIISSSNNTISSNDCRKGDLSYSGKAISIESYSDDNKMLGNNCSGYERGVYAYDHVDRNLISGNDLSYNRYALYLQYAVENCTISDNLCLDNIGHGIYGVNEVKNNIVTGNTIRSNVADWDNNAIYLDGGHGNVISGNALSYPSGSGIYLYNSIENIMDENNCSGNREGIQLRSSDDNLIANNNCSDNNGRGILLVTSHSNEIRNNTCNGNIDGISTVYSTTTFSDHVIIHNNTCNGNDNEGINVQGSYTTITNNTCNGNAGRGVLASSSVYCIIANNTCLGNNIGIWLKTESDWSVVDNNTCSENSQAGVYLTFSYYCMVSNNTCDDNAPNFLGSGILIDSSQDDTVYNNDCTGNYFGIKLTYSSTDNVLRENELLSNRYGIYAETSSGRNLMDGNTITATSNGILLDSVVETVINNTHISGTQTGIYLAYSDHTVVTNNTISSCLDGLYSYYSDYLMIAFNDISGNNNNGIGLTDSIGSVVANNTCIGNAQNGIRVDTFQSGFILNNTFNEAGVGIYLSSSAGNVVVNNNCSLNTANPDFNHGIWLFYSSGNTISNNNCSQNGQHGIYVYYSNDNDISNSTCMDNTGDGIRLTSSDRNNLLNNTCASPNMFYASNNAGIYLESSNHNVIANNTCNDNGDGLHIYSGEYNTVSGNNLSHNNNYLGTKINIKIQASNNNVTNNTCLGSGAGISISSGDGIRIEGNNFSDNIVNGILIYNYEHRNFLIANNTCNNNQYGMWLSSLKDSTVFNNTCNDNLHVGIYLVYRSNNNLISNNTIVNNGYVLWVEGYPNNEAGNGLVVDGIGEYNACDGNSIFNNTIEDSNFYGIRILSSSNNRVFGNVLSGNNNTTSAFDPMWVQAYDDGTNFWNDTTYGNLWADRTSPDAESDGIVDEPYLIDGGDAKDYLPLAISLAVLSPVNGLVTGNASVEISGNAVSYFGVSQVTWYNDATGGSGTCVGTETWSATVALAEGSNHITVTMTDLSGNQAHATITLVQDITPPTLEITSPEEGAFTGGSVTVVWTGSDDISGISHYNISIDGGAWMTATSPYAFNGLAQGDHVIIVKAFDLVGNNASASVNMTVDATPPNVEVLSPMGG